MAEAPAVPVAELDVLMLGSTIPVLLHAWKTKQLDLLSAGFLCGLLLETSCVRLGGTHCHESGVLNFSVCSSGNSVLFYAPWIYVSVVGAQIMASSSIVSKSAWTGLLTGLVCWTYEMQGPLTFLWRWPNEDGLVQKASVVGDLPSLANKPGRGLVTDPFAMEALHPDFQLFGFPIMAPFFDMALGVGIGAVLAALPSMPKLFTVTTLGPLAAVAFIRVPMFIASRLNASLLVVAPCVMALVVVIALMSMQRKPQDNCKLLVCFPMIYQMYWATFTIRAASIPPELKAIVLSISAVGFLVWGKVGKPRESFERADRPYSSWLDALQQDAHASELDFTNTPWWCFVLLSLVQVPVTCAMAYFLQIPVFLAVFPIASHALGFLTAVGLIGSCKYFDIWGEVTFIVLYVWSYSCINVPSARQQLLMACQLLWVFRLGLFLGWRIMVRGSDFRFDKLMLSPAYNAFGWFSQGTWIFLQGFCTWALYHRESVQTPLGILDGLGVVVMLVGLLIEHQADMQKTRWNAAFKSGGQTTFCREGLWKYSRHPNFFGENTVHLGLAIICMNGLPSWELRAIAFVSPVWSCFFLVFTSLMLLEKRMLARLGHLPSYLAYISSTSVLVPWPPRFDATLAEENDPKPGHTTESSFKAASDRSSARRRHASPAPRSVIN